MTRGKIVLAALLVIILLTAGGFVYVKGEAKARYNTERVIFAMDDPKGDDYGPGTYKYPIDSIFDPKKGHFDLQRFSFSTFRNMYYFDVTFPLVTNPWGAPEGFSHTMIQIYISESPDSGRIEPFTEGSNVIFDPGEPWDYFIKVVSFNKTAVYKATDYEGTWGSNKGVSAKLQEDNNTIRVSVPKTLLPGDPYKWKYFVLVGAQDGSGPDNFRVVNAEISRWNFGGGTDTDYDPNIIDLLAPPKKQEEMLKAYSAAQEEQAVIEPVGPAGLSPTRWEDFLDKVIPFMQKIKVQM